MRFKRLKRRTSIVKGQLDIAPMIDVMFNLLLFFMLTSNFVIQSGIKVSLPKAITSEALGGGAENVVVSVTGQDLLFLDDKPVSINELMAQLKEAARRDKAVLLRADTKTSLGRVVEIWDLCREYGIPQINIATNEKAASIS